MQMPRVIRNVYVLFVVLVGWVMFRAESLEYALQFLGIMFGLQGISAQPLTIWQFTSSAMLLMIIVATILAYPIWPRVKQAWLRAMEPGKKLLVDDLVRAAYVGIVMVLSLATMATGQQNPFLYFRF